MWEALSNLHGRLKSELRNESSLGLVISFAYFALIAISILSPEIRKSSAFVIEGWVSVSNSAFIVFSYFITFGMIRSVKILRKNGKTKMQVRDKREVNEKFWKEHLDLEFDNVENESGDRLKSN